MSESTPNLGPAQNPRGPVAALCAPPPNSNDSPPADSIRFRELLERLQHLTAAHRTPPPVEDADQLAAAMRHADDGFVAAMDLRRQLEDAFRRQAP